MKDFLNKSVKIGDKIVFTAVRYSQLEVGEVVSITPKGVKVKYFKSTENIAIVHRLSYQIMKIN